ncbi:MAG: CRTAC1 family protein, partial [Bryobacteraceae bacterium]
SMGVAAADYNNDGHVDLFVAGVNRNTLFRNTGKGRFDDVTRSAGIASSVWSVAGGWFDYDNDGWLDLFVVNYVQWSPESDRFCGDADRAVRVYCHPKYFRGLANVLYRNRGDGTFEDVSAASGLAAHIGKGMSVAFADYDLDNRVDVFVTNDTVPNFLFHNKGDGTFEEAGLVAGVALTDEGRAISSMGTDFRDYDNDGLPDIVLTALTGETFPIFHNEGHGSFRDATHASGLGRHSIKRSGWSVGFVDFNNDGLKDIFTANSHVNDRIEHFEATTYKQANSIFANVGGGRFRDDSERAGHEFSRTAAHRGSAFADFNQDGKIDVVVSTLGAPAELWENITAAGDWLQIRLIGKDSNRDGIGANIRWGSQHNHMTTSSGYLSSSHGPVHFSALDKAGSGEVEIRWPSGKTQRLRPAGLNQIIEVREPEE